MKLKTLILAGIVFMLASCSKEANPVAPTSDEAVQKNVKSLQTTFTFTFDSSQEGWDGGFADCPVDNDFYDLVFSWKRAPGKLGGQYGKSLYITGNNHSDDLFMFVKKQVTGLAPNTTYQLNFNFDIINDIPEGLFGIGGSPGESVFMKFGAVNYEPMAILNDTNEHRQRQPGYDGNRHAQHRQCRQS